MASRPCVICRKRLDVEPGHRHWLTRNGNLAHAECYVPPAPVGFSVEEDRREEAIAETYAHHAHAWVTR